MSLLPFAAVIPPPYHLPLIIYFIFPLSWVGIFLFLSVYDDRGNSKQNRILISVSIGSFFSALFLAGFLYFTFRDISRLFFITFAVLTYTGMLFWRYIANMVLQKLSSDPGNQRRIMIIGTGEMVRTLAEEFQFEGEQGYSLVGVIDNTSSVHKRPSEVIQSTSIQDNIREFRVTDVILAFSSSDHEHMIEIIGILHNMPIKVWLIPDYFQLTLRNAETTYLAGIPLVDLKAPALDYNQRIIKRAFDLSVSLLLSPFIIIGIPIIALVIRIESGRPIFFNSKRVGENGKIFDMYKFRTMVVGAEEHMETKIKEDLDGNHIYKTAEDDRVTRIGKFLRRSSLDEIPQFLNVLKGEMSIVGPRPELPSLVDRYKSWQWQRFSVPQGITGWWQINGRSSKPMNLHTEDDLYYIQNYSLWLDLYIIFKTIVVVWSGRGAF